MSRETKMSDGGEFVEPQPCGYSLTMRSMLALAHDDAAADFRRRRHEARVGEPVGVSSAAYRAARADRASSASSTGRLFSVPSL